MSSFFRQAALLFVALRTADAINLAAGLWLVPRFVDRDELGAVLPLVSFTTVISLPAFAFAFVLMKESNRLAATREFGHLKSLLKGAFLGTSVLLAIALLAAVALIPRFLARMNVSDSSIASLAIGAAFLGCFAPVYQDALNGIKRFGSYSVIEVSAAAARIGTMALIMPFRALCGFFAGNAVQPLVRIAGSLVALRRELRTPSMSYWKPNPLPRIMPLFFGVLLTLIMPMLASLAEQTVIRTALAQDVSASYYLLTRLSDLLNYLTLPILLVLFPYAAETAKRGESTRPLVLRCTLASLVGAAVLALVYAFFGETFYNLIASSPPPPSLDFTLNLLLAINFLTAFQVFYTNSEIAAGRFRFLFWFIPIHLVYIVGLKGLEGSGGFGGLRGLLVVFLLFAAIRALFVLYDVLRRK